MRSSVAACTSAQPGRACLQRGGARPRPRLPAAPAAPGQLQPARQRRRQRAAAAPVVAAAAVEAPSSSKAPTDIEYDAVIIGSGMGGLSTAAQMAAKGAKVVVLEK